MTAGGGQGGSPRHPPAHIACKSVKRARTFCAKHKSLAACADLLPLACFPGSECGVTPLPSPGLPGRPANPSPLPRVYPMNSRCARNHGGPPRVYKERSGPPRWSLCCEAGDHTRGPRYFLVKKMLGWVVGVSSAHPPGVGSFLSLYQPSIAAAQQTPYHPSPPA